MKDKVLTIPVYDQTGKSSEDFTLPATLFGVAYNADLLSQYVHVYRTNQRQGTSDTKTRGEVRGGGRKPWRQKGTGRARHGSTRSPIWRGGGITFGPSPRDYSLSMASKVKRKALAIALSEKLNDGALIVLTGVQLDKPQTKLADALLRKLPVGKRILVVDNGKLPHFMRSLRNLPAVSLCFLEKLNAYLILDTDSVIFTKDALTDFIQRRSLGAKKSTPSLGVKGELVDQNEDLGFGTLALSKKQRDLLEQSGIRSLGELKKKDKTALMAIKGLGEKSVQKILEQLS